MRTFPVSDVPRCQERLQDRTLKDSLERHGARGAEAYGSNLSQLVGARQSFGMRVPHGLVEAVGLAFDLHYPLVLSPDDIWLCLAHGFGIHLNQHAEDLRARLVRHQGKVPLGVRRDDFVRGSAENDRAGVVGQLSDQIATHVGKARDFVVADFSTTGPIERTSSEIALLSAMQHYFEYQLSSSCGIPEITLLGEADDWRSIRRRVNALAEYDLEWWTRPLGAVLDHFVDAADGRVDTEFWQSIYKLNKKSGGPYLTGWIAVLFPYLSPSNRRGNDAREALERSAYLSDWKRGMKQSFGGGPTTRDLPAGLSMAPFTWDCVGQKLDMELLAGFVAVSQDPRTLALRPAIGWSVREKPPSAVSA
jgi:hypothetical protein